MHCSLRGVRCPVPRGDIFWWRRHACFSQLLQGFSQFQPSGRSRIIRAPVCDTTIDCLYVPSGPPKDRVLVMHHHESRGVSWPCVWALCLGLVSCPLEVALPHGHTVTRVHGVSPAKPRHAQILSPCKGVVLCRQSGNAEGMAKVTHSAPVTACSRM